MSCPAGYILPPDTRELVEEAKNSAEEAFYELESHRRDFHETGEEDRKWRRQTRRLRLVSIGLGILSLDLGVLSVIVSGVVS